MSGERVSTKRMIRHACLQVIGNPSAKPGEKLKAAALLERMVRTKALARRRKLGQSKCVNIDTKGRMNDILGQVANG